MNHKDPVWSQLKSFVFCEERDFETVEQFHIPEEISDFISHGAKAGVKVEYGLVGNERQRHWTNDGEDEWRFKEELEERDKNL
jgi:hypothetical protein